MPVRDDGLLIGEIQRANIAAFEELFDRYCDRAWRVALSVCGDERLATGAVEQAFASIWHNSSSYNPRRETLAAWLFTTVCKRAVAVARAHQTDDEHRPVTTARGSLQALLRRHLKGRALDRTLPAFMNEIPDSLREVIALALYGELALDEIAACLDLSSETVKNRMRLGLHELAANRKQIAPEHSTNEPLPVSQRSQARRQPSLGRRRSPHWRPSGTARPTR